MVSRMTPREKSERGKKAITQRWKNVKGKDYQVALPRVEYKGTGFLGDKNNDIECYVLDNKERVLSFRQVVKLITGKESGDLGSYLSPIEDSIEKAQNEKTSKKPHSETSPKPLSFNCAQVVDFIVPETGLEAKGISAEFFSDICSAYVSAAYMGLLKTDRQKEIALKCAHLQTGFMRTGIIGWVDEITGYQNYRAKDDLQMRMNAYIAESIRDWEKTYPDEYYQSLARLCGYSDWRKKPAHYSQITNRVYQLVDPDIAVKLKTLDQDQNIDKHQYMTTFGRQQLKKQIYKVIGIADMCGTIQEFNSRLKTIALGLDKQLELPFMWK